jgi:hypothetical protein
MCFYALLFQLFPILVGTLVSFIQGNLSPADAWFALLVMLSPTTLELLDLLPYNLRRSSKWSLREIIDGISIALLLVLSIALYIIIVIFLSGNIDDCPLEGFSYTSKFVSSQIGNYVAFAISLFTVYLTIQGGGGTWKRDQHSHFFFSWIWLTPPHPLPTKYSMFSEFQCFF